MRWLLVCLVVLAACSAGPPTDEGIVDEPATSVVASESSDPLVATTEPAAEELVTTTSGEAGEGCADVIDASVSLDADGRYTVSATVRSADTGWDKYADLWTVAVDGSVVGERVLTHPHENEQPFTRSLAGVEIPDGTTEVVVAARDSVAGFCGEEFVAAVPQ